MLVILYLLLVILYLLIRDQPSVKNWPSFKELAEYGVPNAKELKNFMSFDICYTYTMEIMSGTNFVLCLILIIPYLM